MMAQAIHPPQADGLRDLGRLNRPHMRAKPKHRAKAGRLIGSCWKTSVNDMDAIANADIVSTNFFSHHSRLHLDSQSDDK
ncbi:MAG TPA: hypothetical protein DDW52_06295 [Planctomycetaceae bacterium]|nr:hypothetical protein [Planctomycetaceae bacterium]